MSSKQRVSETRMGALALVLATCQLSCGDYAMEAADKAPAEESLADAMVSALPDAGAMLGGLDASAAVDAAPIVPPAPALAGSAAPLPMPMNENAAGAPAAPKPPLNPTTSYHRDIRPVLENACVSCHAAGNISPLPLDSWQSVQLMAAEVVDSVLSGAMPPWPADDSCHALRDTRVLSQATMDLFQRWRDESFPEGTALDYRAQTQLANGANLGDATLTFDSVVPYTPPAQLENYRCFMAEYVFPKDTFLSAVEVLPDQRAEIKDVQVHSVSADQRTQLQVLDLLSAEPGFNCNLELVPTDVMFGWQPGASRIAFDAASGMFMPSGSSVMIQVHYDTTFLPGSGAPTPDLTKVNVWTMPEGEVPERVVYRQEFRVPLLTLPVDDPHTLVEAILPMEIISAVGPTGQYVPGEIIGMTPRARHLATYLGARLLPEGSTQQDCLIDVPNWEYGFQYDYQFDKAIPYAPSDQLYVSCTYDNSPEHQPFINGVQQPSQRVRSGDGPLDELCSFYVWLRMDRKKYLGIILADRKDE